MRKPRSYLSRNRDIVRDTEMLVATPGEEAEHLRSGTWSTVRFARKLGRSVWVILPNGTVRREQAFRRF
jgi:predicted Rossmann fold nucleotide-binding protein DprA/Smf involved in DNA uptake